MLNKEPVYFAGGRNNVVVLAQKFLGEVLTDGSVAVDATAGNGHDTLFLARAVGNRGRVYGFDIQPTALQNTAAALQQHQLNQKVTLLAACHGDLAQYVQEPVDGVILNLGYLPGGDHAIITKPDTTLAAVKAALTLIKPGGRISIVVYPGHPGGARESETLRAYIAQVDPAEFGVLLVTLPNRSAGAPYLILMERVKK